MPNYVRTHVKFGCDGATFIAILAAMRGPDYDTVGKSSPDERKYNPFDFNQVIPMPAELRDTTAPSWTEPYVRMAFGEAPWEYEIQKRGVIDKITKKPLAHFTDEEYDEYLAALLRFRKFGHINWYSWSCDNWGTKWNSMNHEINEEECVITFDTAWSLCDPVLREVSKRYPEVSITVEYADEDIGNNCGRIHYLAGEASPDEIGDSVIFACKVWGLDPAEYIKQTGDESDAPAEEVSGHDND